MFLMSVQENGLQACNCNRLQQKGVAKYIRHFSFDKESFSNSEINFLFHVVFVGRPEEQPTEV